MRGRDNRIRAGLRGPGAHVMLALVSWPVFSTKPRKPIDVKPEGDTP